MRWIFVVLMLATMGLHAQSRFDIKINEVVKNLYSDQPDSESPVTLNAALVVDGDSLAVIMKVLLAPGWHIYQFVPQTMPYIPIDYILELPKGISAVGGWKKPVPISSTTDPGVLIYEDEVVFVQKAFMKETSTDLGSIKTGLYYQACDLKQCLPPQEKLFELKVAANDALQIGDKAPDIKFSKWIKGEPVTGFQKESHLYVLEFWATWCGPCRTAMPHLTKLQAEYKDEITVIGVNIWEDGKRNQPYEQFIPKVEDFVRANNENMGYALMIDDNAQFMGNNWMKAAGLQGIPSTFIVRNKVIIWIGNPDALDTTISAILNGRFNVSDYKTSQEEKVAALKERMDKMNRIMSPIQEAMDARQFSKALEIVTDLRPKYPEYGFELDATRFFALLGQRDEKAIMLFGQKWIKNDKRAGRVMLDALLRQADLPKRLYVWGAKTYETSAPQMTAFDYNRLASLYAKGDDFKNAVKQQELAVSTAEAQLKESKTGAMTEAILENYRKLADNYKTRNR